MYIYIYTLKNKKFLFFLPSGTKFIYVFDKDRYQKRFFSAY